MLHRILSGDSFHKLDKKQLQVYADTAEETHNDYIVLC